MQVWFTDLLWRDARALQRWWNRNSRTPEARFFIRPQPKLKYQKHRYTLLRQC